MGRVLKTAETIDMLQPDGVNVFPAHYTPALGIFRGNPLCEALDPTPRDSDYEALYSSFPPAPTAATRRMSVEDRRQEMLVMADVVVYFQEWREIAQALDDMIRQAYAWRNPMTVQYKVMAYGQARHGENIPTHKPGVADRHARGMLVMSVTGMGKTTFVRMYRDRYPKVIAHTTYQGHPFKAHQIPIVFLSVPHDGTISGLCREFFDYVDGLLGTEYAMQARGLRTIAPQIQLMKDVARACSVGLLVIDEVQNLRSVESDYADRFLNLLSEIIEKVGISVLSLATPALRPVVEKSARNIRKISSLGSRRIEPMGFESDQWRLFTETYWRYMYLRDKPSKLTPEIRQTWHKLSGGDSAFAALIFYLAQRGELGDGQEYLDIASFQRAFERDMTFLVPAIQALNSGDQARLEKFEDLYDGDLLDAIRDVMADVDALPHDGRPGHAPDNAADEEPPESSNDCEGGDAPRTPRKRPSAKPKAASPDAKKTSAKHAAPKHGAIAAAKKSSTKKPAKQNEIVLPTEDPLASERRARRPQ